MRYLFVLIFFLVDENLGVFNEFKLYLQEVSRVIG